MKIGSAPLIVRPGEAKNPQWKQVVSGDPPPGFRRHWHVVDAEGQYLMGVAQALDDRCVVVYHRAGDERAMMEKCASLELAKTAVGRILSETAIIPRLW